MHKSQYKVPDVRIRCLNTHLPRTDAAYVLYWMIASRRLAYNFGLQRAAIVSETLNKPLVIFEPLRVGYQWASDRLHSFIMQGMMTNAQLFADWPVTYIPWLERSKSGESKGLLKALARDACMLITDDYPAFFIPRMLEAAASQVPCRMEAVDSNGILPMAAVDKVFLRAYDFRRYLQKNLPQHLDGSGFPEPNPLAHRTIPRMKILPEKILGHWSMATVSELTDPRTLETLDIDHSVRPASLTGGSIAASEKWDDFARSGLRLYAQQPNHPDNSLSSGLSPWIHFGHIGTHDIFTRVMAEAGKEVGDLTKMAEQGQQWWGLDAACTAFLDELVTWREIGFNMASKMPGYDKYESLPGWAKDTLEQHQHDRRPYIYSREAFEAAETHDELWNAAQNQLRREGQMHNYLRMLWGKKILHWSENPRTALRTMIELNNRYALDGRDPNSYSGIFWVLGRYDRAWGPEREVFGKIRYMTSNSTRKKLRVNRYIARWSASG
ncbi:MAG: deoxyribodipyrimidine photolyase [Myxococcales bacterium]|nr:deoxyribodipyrimidine photolyase [Myxococcales bacterium]